MSFGDGGGGKRARSDDENAHEQQREFVDLTLNDADTPERYADENAREQQREFVDLTLDDADTRGEAPYLENDNFFDFDDDDDAKSPFSSDDDDDMLGGEEGRVTMDSVEEMLKQLNQEVEALAQQQQEQQQSSSPADPSSLSSTARPTAAANPTSPPGAGRGQAMTLFRYVVIFLVKRRIASIDVRILQQMYRVQVKWARSLRLGHPLPMSSASSTSVNEAGKPVPIEGPPGDFWCTIQVPVATDALLMDHFLQFIVPGAIKYGWITPLWNCSKTGGVPSVTCNKEVLEAQKLPLPMPIPGKTDMSGVLRVFDEHSSCLNGPRLRRIQETEIIHSLWLEPSHIMSAFVHQQVTAGPDAKKIGQFHPKAFYACLHTGCTKLFPIWSVALQHIMGGRCRCDSGRMRKLKGGRSAAMKGASMQKCKSILGGLARFQNV